MRYEKLVNQFEEELGRKLKQKEKEFIHWICERHKKEQRIK